MTLFSFLKEQLPILNIISEFVQIKPAGHYWKGSCPFHAEKDASFTVSPDKQIYYCFGCHASGDVIGFIARVENITQLEAARYLIDRYGIQVPQHLLQATQTQALQDKDERDRIFKLCKAIALWAHSYLLQQKSPQEYVLSRSINKTSLELFHIGYFPSGTNAINGFVKDMASTGFLLKDLLENGFIMEGRSALYSPFEERVLFPITDTLGRFCGFGGRTFKQGDDRPKYYNSKESGCFEKGKLLFGLDKAKKALLDNGTGFLVEGYMDCIMMVQHGYQNTVATLGTACTSEHLKILSRYIHTLYVLYDGDQAGQKAMLRLTELCWEVDLELKVISLPAGHDPASFLVAGQSLETYITEAQDIISFFITSTGSNFASKPLSQKLSVAEKITAIISRVNPAFKQDLLLHQTAVTTQLPFSSLKELMLSSHKTRPNYLQFENSTPEPEADKTDESEEINENSLLEEKIISVILNRMHEENASHIPDDIRAYFSPAGQRILQHIDLLKDKEQNDRSIHRLLEMVNEKEKQWVTRISVQHNNQGCQQSFEYLLTRFYKLHWQKIVKDTKELVIKAKKAQNEQMVHEILERFSERKQEILHHSRGLIR